MPLPASGGDALPAGWGGSAPMAERTLRRRGQAHASLCCSWRFGRCGGRWV